MNWKPLLILPPIALGVAGFIWMTAPEEQSLEPQPEARLAVRVMPVVAQPLVVTATGYGRVEAVRNWTAVLEVDGRITGVYDGLAEGTLVEEGALLVQIDPTDYELAIQKARANIAAAQASLAELAEQEANSRRLLEIEQRVLDVARAEYERVSDLADRGTSTQSALDTAIKTLLAQETSFTNLQNTLALYPAQRASVEATLAVRRAELAEAERALAHTTIRAPFDGLVTEANAETGQFVRTGEQLLTLGNVDAVEVVASMQPRALAPVLRIGVGRDLAQATESDPSKMLERLAEAGITATVRLQLAEFDRTFPAEIVRFTGAIDNETGTIGIAVRVDIPKTRSGTDEGPPLSTGSFVSVDLSTLPTDGLIAVPRAAVHQDDAGNPFVYTADGDDRLAIDPVVLGAVIDDSVVLREGLVEGDRLVLSAPRPPIEGLLLTPVTDDGSK